MMHQAPCSKCGGSLEFDAESLGTPAICPHCGQEILLSLPASARNNKVAIAVITTVLAVCVVATIILTRSRSAGHPIARQAPARSSAQQNATPPETVTPKAVSTLLNPIIGAFGYQLGDKLPDGLRIGPSQTFTLETTNYPPFESLTIRCASDRTICTIAAFSMDDNHDALLQDMNGKYGPGTPLPDYEGKITAIKWSDGNRELQLDWFVSIGLTCHDIALEQTANEQFEVTIKETMRKLIQPSTGTLGWKLSEKLPAKLSINPVDHVYWDRNYWPFELSVFCLNDRRIYMVTASKIFALPPGFRATSKSNFIKDYLEKQCGQGTPVTTTNGIHELRWSDGGREISLAGTTVTFRDIALGKTADEERERADQEAALRLLQPIAGAFGYKLGEKLRSGLPIDPQMLSYSDEGAHFLSIKNVFVDCLRDRRISSITAVIASEQFDNVKRMFEKTYGVGSPWFGDGEMWSDGKHKIIVAGRYAICNDMALDAQWTKEHDEQKALYKLRQPITGAFGYKLGDKLPEGRFIDPVSHAYTPKVGEVSDEFLSFFPILVNCLNDRRICRITGTVDNDQADAIRTTLEKKYGTGLSEGNGIVTWGWGDYQQRTISLTPRIIMYEDEVLLEQLKNERDHEEKERQKATMRGL